MKKRIITFILSIFTLLILTSCDIYNHQHIFKDEWSRDKIAHWHDASCEHTAIKDFGQHSFGDWENLSEATEEAEGKQRRTCTVCGYEEFYNIPKLEAHSHTFKDTWSNNDEYHWYDATCDHDVVANKGLHKFGDIIIDTEPTEEETGLGHQVCSVCGYSKEVVLDKEAHVHTFEDELSFDNLYHYHKSTCGHDDQIIYVKHTFGDWQIVEVPTGTKDGLMYKQCSVCGYKYEEKIAKLDHEHTFETDWTNDEYGHWHNSSCGHDVTSGYALHDYDESNKCKQCGYEKTTDVVVDDSYDASFEWNSDNSSVTITLKNKNDSTDVITKTLAPTVTTKDSTCTVKGSVTYKVSLGYKGILYEDSKVIELALKDHKYIKDGFYENGNEFKYKLICSVCGDLVYRDCEVEKVSETDSICTVQGKITYKVTYEDETETFVLEKELDPNNHTYGDWTDVDSHQERTCTSCGHKEIYEENADIIREGIYSGNYYNSITTEMLSNADLLKSTLNSIINANYKRYSYNGAQTQLKTVDSYDEYYVECIYTGERLEKSDAWDREHVWAKSYGFNDESYYDAYTDMHHLRVSEHSINNNRSSSYFDVVLTPEHTDVFGNKWTSTVFEPRDEVKGDIARMLIYMTVKYDDPDKLDLELTDDANKINAAASVFGGFIPDMTNFSDSKKTEYNKRKYIGGTDDPTAYLGMLSTLIKWHFEDPVDAREVSRNNKLFEIQKNRNPFIDHPEYVYYLYRTQAQQYVKTDAELSEYATHYKNFNRNAIDKINAKIQTIGTVTLNSKTLLDEINESYNKLGSITKSFVTNYYILKEANEEYQRLYEKANQNTTIPSTFNFLNLSAKTGAKSYNGIDIEFSASNFNSSYGIYAQIDKNKVQSNATIKASGLYGTIKYVKFSWNNNKANHTATVQITSSNTTTVVNVSNLTVKGGSTNNEIYVDISSLLVNGSYGDLTITIKNDATESSSVRIKEISFTLTN